jgi:hypothetical protein
MLAVPQLSQRPTKTGGFRDFLYGIIAEIEYLLNPYCVLHPDTHLLEEKIYAP